MRHLKYLSYIIRHKWFVLIAGLKIGAPLWRLIIHDWSKFLPSEWGAYARTFYGPGGEDPQFNAAWNHHQKRNKHHWQYWTLWEDNGHIRLLKMPRKYMLEMVADWMGAGRAITGEWDVMAWYEKNQRNIRLHTTTREQVEKIIYRPQP